MSDVFYKTVRSIGGFGLWTSGRPTVIGLENLPRSGGCIIAATHQSYFDVPLLIYHTPRLLDIVSIVEEFRKPILGWFYGSMNAFPLDRSRADPKTVRTIIDRLARGRSILLFPEGGIRAGEDSVVHSGRIRPGIGRIARLAQVPVIPAVLINSGVYMRVSSWLPLWRVRYGLMYGQPVSPMLEPEAIEARIVSSMIAMNMELRRAMTPSSG
jgi:1-acyl-sn-glycerol-3-phosphate acyltransferase